MSLLVHYWVRTSSSTPSYDIICAILTGEHRPGGQGIETMAIRPYEGCAGR